MTVYIYVIIPYYIEPQTTPRRSPYVRHPECYYSRHPRITETDTVHLPRRTMWYDTKLGTAVNSGG